MVNMIYHLWNRGNEQIIIYQTILIIFHIILKYIVDFKNQRWLLSIKILFLV